MLLLVAGVPMTGTSASICLCLALLLFGLPHGALDIERLKSARQIGLPGTVELFVIYLALAGTAYATWTISPVVALAIFIGCAVRHFGEDWVGMDHPMLALGTAVALLASPALLHKEELRAIFVVVTGEVEGALLAEMMHAIAPVALALALTGMIGLVRAERSQQAACCALLVAAMIIAPPLPAFALFFCLYHSPLHLREAWASVATSYGSKLVVVAALTGASAAIAVLLAVMEWRGSLERSLVAATFMTFSVLTVPHMLVPVIVKQLRLRRRVVLI
jgi:Brp/Blh family beta-carotene 15,15'-monooxygenase